MRTLFVLLAALPAALGLARAQQLPPAPETMLQPDSTGQGFDYLWDGTQGSTYFVLGTEDLASWFYFNVMDQGDPDGHRFWFYSNAPRFFLRLRYTAGPTYPWSDPDGDTLTNAFELENSLILGLDPFDADSDDDNVSDGDEDPDGDGLTNAVEQRLGLNPATQDSDNDGAHDDLEDTDQDGIGNLAEINAGLDPGNPDSDGDGIPDGEDPDPLNPELLVLGAGQPRVLSPLE